MGMGGYLKKQMMKMEKTHSLGQLPNPNPKPKICQHIRPKRKMRMGMNRLILKQPSTHLPKKKGQNSTWRTYVGSTEMETASSRKTAEKNTQNSARGSPNMD